MRLHPADDDGPSLEDAIEETKTVLAEASRVWARHGCPGTAECCQLSTTKRQPWLWPSEWAVLEDSLRRARRVLPPPRADGGCPFLDAAGLRCTVYDARPFGCRTFFCHRRTGPEAEPSMPTHRLLDQVASLNIAYDASAQPRALFDWIAQARVQVDDE